MIQVIESFLKGKKQQADLCEDGFVVTPHYAVVIDGVTAKTDMDFAGKTSGRYLMELIKEYILHMEGHADAGAGEFIAALSEHIREDYQRQGWLELLRREPLLRPAASLLVYSAAHKELWFFGDCKAYMDGVQYDNDKYIDKVMLEARKLFIEGELLAGKTIEAIREQDTGRQFIEPLLKIQQVFQNDNGASIFSYSAVDGFAFRSEDIRIVKVSEDVQELVMATDGYAVLKGTVKETESILQETLSNDPLAIEQFLGFSTYKSDLHSYDDRAYLRIGVVS